MDKQKLASTLWSTVEDLRGNVEAYTYKDYILGLLFYKFLSDKEYELLSKEFKLSDEEIEEITEEDEDIVKYCEGNLGFFIEPKYFYRTWVNDIDSFTEDDLITALNAYERHIPEKSKHVFGGVFDTISRNLTSLAPSSNERTKSLRKLLIALRNIPTINTEYDVLGYVYEYLISKFSAGAGKKGGEFFTPAEVSTAISRIVDHNLKDKDVISVLDPTVGTGGFLVTAMTYVMKQLRIEFEKETGKLKSEWDDFEKKAFQDKISDMAMNNYFGFDINPDLVKATKMNMVMNNDGSGNILQNNSLLQPHEWTDDFKTRLSAALQIDKKTLINKDSIGYFDVIVTNPPFGSKIPIKDHAILSQFDLAKIWKQDKKTGKWTITDRYQSSVSPEILFIERCYQFLKPGGRMGIVLPDALLGSPGTGYIREWLIKYTKIIASIDLHEDTFQPRNGTQTSVLILQKKTEEEISKEETTGQMADYNIYMAIVDKIGHDKRGNTLFKRDNDGNEIMVPEKQNIYKLDETSSGFKTAQMESREKVVDDQTILIPNIFRKWKINEGISW